MIGFLLGAGFSTALHGNMPITNQLLQMLELGEKLPDYIPEPIRSDLERTLSFLWTNYPWHSEPDALRNQSDYLRLVNTIHYILSSMEFEAWHELFHQNKYSVHGTWQGELAYIMCNKDCVVLTMNYDTLLERLMIAMNQENWLLYPGPIQRLYGAWSQRMESSYGLITPDFIGTGSFSPRLYKLHGSLSWYSLNPLEGSSIIYGLDMDKYFIRTHDRVPGGFDEALLPVIIPPVADKASLYSNKALRSQWIGALNGLRECDELYCVGYSFPKSDLPMQLFLTQASDNLKSVHIVNIHEDHQLEDRVSEIFKSSIAIEGHFYGDNCVEQMTRHLADSRQWRESNLFP